MKKLLVTILCAICASSALAKERELLSTNPDVTSRLITKPHFDYPYEALRDQITGSGTVVAKVNAAGIVTSVRMGFSTGSPLLDRAALAGVKRTRFKPGPPFTFRTPVTFFFPQTRR